MKRTLVLRHNVSLEHKSSVFVAIDNNTLYGSKLYVSVMPKIIRIIRSIKMFNKCPIINVFFD